MKEFFNKKNVEISLKRYGIDALSAKSQARYYCEENIKRLEMIKSLAEKYEMSVASVVCAVLTSIDIPNVFPIIGGSRKEQIVDSLVGADIVIDKDEIRNILKFNI